MYQDPNFTVTVNARTQINNLFQTQQQKPSAKIEFKRQYIPGTYDREDLLKNPDGNPGLAYEGESSVDNLRILAQYSYSQGKDLSNEVLFQKLYPGKPYHDQLLRNKQNLLTRKLERFIAWKQLESDPSLQSQLLGKRLLDQIGRAHV